MTALQLVYPNVPILTCIQLLTSASIIYHHDYSAHCHWGLRVVQNFYTSQFLGVHRHSDSR